MNILRKTASAIALSVFVCLLAGCNNPDSGSSTEISSNTDESSTASSTDPTDAPEQTSSQPADTSESVTTAPSDTTSEPDSAPEPSDVWNPALSSDRETIAENGCIAGIAYIGYVEPEADEAACREMFLSSDYSISFPEVCDIPLENVVRTGGCELYLVIPAKPDMTVEVYESRFVEDGEGISFVNGDVLYSSDFGAPFLLKCNVSDIMQDASIEITADGVKYKGWCPCISLENGRAAVFSDEIKVYDFTIYETEYQDVNI